MVGDRPVNLFKSPSMKRLYSAIGVVSIMLQSAGSAQEIPVTSRATADEEIGVLINITPIPQGEIGKVVADVMAEVVKGNRSRVPGLSLRADEAIPYLPAFAISANDLVRSAAAEVASLSQSEKAVQILTVIAGGKGSSATVAVERLFIVYSPVEILKWGNRQLAKSLMRYLERVPNSAEGILLLSCFKSDKSVPRFLHRHRKKHAALDLMITRPEESPLVKAPVCIDISLSELGKTDAAERLGGYLTGKSIDDILFILHAMKVINNRGTLLKISELLKDSRVAFETGLSHSSEPPMIIRVNDIALHVLRYKLNPGKDQSGVNYARRSPDEEIARAYEEFGTAIRGNHKY